MTAQEKDRIQNAIRHIQTAVGVKPWAVKIAVEAMEKQVLKKPIEKPDKYDENLWHLYCPSCKNWIGMWNSRVKHRNMYNNSNSHICSHCGQAIDWMAGE